jgi:AraC-like DNA-binding protein
MDGSSSAAVCRAASLPTPERGVTIDSAEALPRRAVRQLPNPPAHPYSNIVEWQGTLVVGPGIAVYCGSGGESAPHAHHAVQIACSFDRPFRLNLDRLQLDTRAACIPSEVRHAVLASSTRLSYVLIDPHGRRGLAVARRARELAGKEISAWLGEPAPPDPNPVSLAHFGAELIDALAPSPSSSEPTPISEDIREAIDYVEQTVDRLPRLEDAARLACLSPSRLTHRFSAEVGLPFRRFVVWARIRRSALAVAGGANLTQAAIATGFSDSSHLSRVFRATFGVTPSTMLGMQVAAIGWPSTGADGSVQT